MNKIALLKGGLNSENEVSLKTAEACMLALKELKYDIVEINTGANLSIFGFYCFA